MKLHQTLLVIFMVFQNLGAQVEFTVENIDLSNYHINLNRNIIDENLENGPFIYLNCQIINNTNTSILLKPSKSEIKIIFRFNDLDYKIEVYPLPFVEIKELIIEPNNKININFGSYLLLGTDIHIERNGNYIKEMISILPTLKILYQDEQIKLKTSEIRNVRVNN